MGRPFLFLALVLGALAPAAGGCARWSKKTARPPAAQVSPVACADRCTMMVCPGGSACTMDAQCTPRCQQPPMSRSR